MKVKRSKSFYELQVGKSSMRVSRKWWNDFQVGAVRTLYSFITILSAALLGFYSGALEGGYIPTDTFTVGSAIFMIIIATMGTCGGFLVVVSSRNWGRTKR